MTDAALFNQWAIAAATERNGRPPIESDFVVSSESGHLAAGLDHGFYVFGYPVWGPSAKRFAETELGQNEVALVITPYDSVPSFNPAEIHIEPLPICIRAGVRADVQSFVCSLRDPIPNGEVWKWFTRPIEAGMSLSLPWLSHLLPECSKYSLLLKNRFGLYGPSYLMAEA